ncbi:MAG TPA: choice-of-anchor L domain-containing protein, partial [Cryomorphaceae bacterium]|nr:choice-of-anchor L domain-containing protein [Cryomorphaceae bacterium]
MKKFITHLVGIVLSLLLVNSGLAQLSASNSTDATELIDLFLSENSNLTYSNATLIGAEGAAGTYEGADFDENNGVILSTGEVAEAAGPNENLGNSTNFETEGDDDLEDLADKSTFDAVSLSADFIPDGSYINFKYAFASEDYNSYVCSPFSDVLGIFVTGGGYANENIAFVPGTDLLVTSNTINGGTEGDVWNAEGCPEGGLENADLYIDNTGGLNYEYNGRTVFLNTELAVTPGETYTIRWALADGADGIFDSALFLEAGSLSASEDDCTADGGELTVDGPTVICKSDGVDDSFSLEVEGAEGENMIFVVTFDDGEIIALSENGEFNLEGIPGNGTCLFWNLSWDGEIEGAQVGENAFDITGDCFDLSNSV